MVLSMTALGQDPRLDRFKKRIGYQPVAQKMMVTASGKDALLTADSGMVGAWPDVKNIPGVNGNWNLERASIFSNAGVLVNEWKMRNSQGARLSIICSNYESDSLAEAAFFGMASESTMPEIPLGATKKRIGNISASLMAGLQNDRNEVYVCNHNYNIKVKCYGASFDVEPIAEWLNTFAESKIISNYKSYRPTPKRVLIIPEAPRIGQEFEIHVEMAGGNTPGRYILKDNLGLEIEKFMDQFSTVGREGIDSSSLIEVMRAKKSGKGVYKYTLIDRQTSLLYNGEVEIEVAP